MCSVTKQREKLDEPEEGTPASRVQRLWPHRLGARALETTETAHLGQEVRPGARCGGRGAMLE